MSIFTSLRTRIPLAMCAGRLFGARRFPELTQILAGRNDDYGEQPVERLTAVIDWNRRWLGCRTLFVEWNPPDNAPLLSEMLTDRYPDVDCYVVARELHQQIAGPEGMAFQEFHAKNVGIRRARTDWLLVLNSDIVMGPDCLLGLRAAPESDEILRTRRVDLAFPGQCPSFLYLLDGRRYLRFRVIGEPNCSAPGDFSIVSKQLWHRAGGYDEALANHRFLADVRGMWQLMAHGARLRWIGTHFHFDHSESTSHGVVASTHGESFDPNAGIPYENPESWGLAGAREELIGERIWRLAA